MPTDKQASRAREEFLVEAQELVEALSRDVLLLEASGRQGEPDPETLNDLFRAVHTLKGLSGMFGFERIARLSHVLEDTLENLRLGRIVMTKPVLDVVFEGVEAFQKLLGEETKGLSSSSVDIEAFAAHVGSLARSTSAEHDVIRDFEIESSVLSVLTEYEEHRLRTNLLQGFSVYRLRVRIGLEVIDTELEHLKEQIKGLAEVITYLPSMEGGVTDSIEIEMLLASRADESALRAAITRPDAMLSRVRRRTSQASELEVPRSKAPFASASLASPPKSSPSVPAVEPSAELALRTVANVVRVDIRKLDHLMNVVGELSAVRAAFSRLLDRLRPKVDHSLASEAQRIARALSRQIAAMQAGVLDIRMVPLSQLFDKVAVVVRQVARDQRKEVRLVVTGADTEVDKRIVEELSDPLMHLVRNAIDHGVEGAEQRAQQGKPAVATVAINAYQKGSSVVIELSDDGRGIDPDALREEAIRRGLVSEQAVSEMSRQELIGLVFVPGFSTAHAVSDLSGRGVGMDVVKTNIARLGGAVDLESEVGVGTKVAITLPITLAIMSALLFELRGRTFALPLAAVREALRLPEQGLRSVEGRPVLTLRGATLPLTRLAELFRLSARPDAPETSHESFVIVVASGQRRLGLCVDRLVGQQDIVIKALGRSLAGVPGISGATNLGDGRLVLVVDAASIVEEVLSGKAPALALGGAS